MKAKTKELIEQLTSYYEAHPIENFVKGSDERLQNFVVDDFSGLLVQLNKELQDES